MCTIQPKCTHWVPGAPLISNTARNHPKLLFLSPLYILWPVVNAKFEQRDGHHEKLKKSHETKNMQIKSVEILTGNSVDLRLSLKLILK